MNHQQDNNGHSRIAKNTLLLYLRMLLLTLVSLYTSRVILDALGVDDYGIYNVVGGVVTMFLVLSGSLSAAITRFMTYEMGKKNKERLSQVFSTSVTIQFGIALLVLLLAETIGLWFVNTQLVIPESRLNAANWCYQFSLITFCINLISIPYNAAIISHERMGAFAYISIFEAVGRLAIALSIALAPIDRLIYYSSLVAALAILVRFIYVSYCRQKFTECHYRFMFDKSLLKEMAGFMGWNLIGTSSYVMREHGGTILTNIFFGPTVNAARALAMKVNTVIKGFVQNFMIALNPQITKNYASGNHKETMNLVFLGSRFSFYILMLFALPIMMCTNTILSIWLKEVPNYTVVFIQLILILSLSESLSNPLITLMLATGKIRNYQIVVGGIYLLNIPISYAFLHFGFGPSTVLIISIVLSQIGLFARLIMLRPLVNFPITAYLHKVYLNVLIVTAVSLILPISISFFVDNNIWIDLSLGALTLICVVLTTYLVGCNREEQNFIHKKLNQFVQKFKHA